MRETAPVADDDDGHDDDTVYSDAGDGSDSEHRPVSAEFLNPDLPPGVLQESHWNPLYGGLT